MLFYYLYQIWEVIVIFQMFMLLCLYVYLSSILTRELAGIVGQFACKQAFLCDTNIVSLKTASEAAAATRETFLFDTSLVPNILATVTCLGEALLVVSLFLQVIR